MTTRTVQAHHNYNPRSQNFAYHFGWGVRFFFSGLLALFTKPSLLGLSLIPIIVTLVLLIGLAVGAAWLIGSLISDWVNADLRAAAQAIIFVLALLLGYFIYLPLARVILAPFTETLSRKTHAINTGQNYRSNQNWVRAVFEGLKLATLHILISVAAIVLGIAFPPVGAPVAIFVAVFLCALDFFDISLSARGMPLSRKLGVIGNNKFLALGFGLAAYVLLLIPVVNLLSIPVAVIGATLLTDALEAGNALSG